ncbi:restriction endonuclease [bacterium]|nr:restriction endonuclease [bacterium]
MAIPNYQEFMLPTLEVIADGQEHKNSNVVQAVAKILNLTEEDMQEMLPSGNQQTYYNRAGWARTYLKKAGLLEYPSRGFMQITEAGRSVMANKPLKIDNKFLSQFEQFDQFKNNRNNEILETKEDEIFTDTHTPDEIFEVAEKEYFNSLKQDLLDALKKVDPVRFERIVLDLMEKMNYGIGEMTKRSHDGGIDGIINEDELGLQKIYLQAKRYSENKVNEKEIQNFVGALDCSDTNKGVFITTSYFCEKAQKKALAAKNKIIRLINGEELVTLMIRYNLGVQTKKTYTIKRVDEDYLTGDL